MSRQVFYKIITSVHTGRFISSKNRNIFLRLFLLGLVALSGCWAFAPTIVAFAPEFAHVPRVPRCCTLHGAIIVLFHPSAQLCGLYLTQQNNLKHVEQLIADFLRNSKKTQKVHATYNIDKNAFKKWIILRARWMTKNIYTEKGCQCT